MITRSRDMVSCRPRRSQYEQHLTVIDPLLTADEVAKRLNVSKDCVWDHSSRRLPYLPDMQSLEDEVRTAINSIHAELTGIGPTGRAPQERKAAPPNALSASANSRVPTKNGSLAKEEEMAPAKPISGFGICDKDATKSRQGAAPK